MGSPLRRAGVFILLTLLAGCGKSEPVIKIGFVAPLTGDQAAHGADMLQGAQLALDEARAAGEIIPGYKVELAPLDDNRSPAQAVSAAKRLAADRDVLAVVGHLNSSCTKPASAIYYEARLLHLCPVSSNPEISRQGFDTFYRICPTDDLQGPAGVRYAVQKLGAKRIFVLDDMTTYGRGLANEFLGAAKGLPVEILGHEGITQGEKDFTPVLTKIKGLNPDLIYFAGMFPEAALLLKQKLKLGLSAKFLGGDGLFEPALIELATPEAAEGMSLTTLGGDIRSLPTAQRFVQAFEAKHGHLGAYSWYAYESTQIALEAIRRAGKKDRTAVIAAMKGMGSYSGILGLHTFDSKGDTSLRVIGIYTVRGGKFEFVEAVHPSPPEADPPLAGTSSG